MACIIKEDKSIKDFSACKNRYGNNAMWDEEHKKCYFKLICKIHIGIYQKDGDPFSPPIYEDFLDVEIENAWFDKPNRWDFEIEKPVLVDRISVGSDEIFIFLNDNDNEVFPSIFKGIKRIKKKYKL